MSDLQDRIQLRSPRLYRYAHFYMLRAPALPASIFSQLSATGEELNRGNLSLAERLQIRRDHCYQLLHKLAVQPEITLALAAASSSLEEELARLQYTSNASPRVRRSFASILRYIIRMSTRPTPFGLFSGIALGTFADQTDVKLTYPPLQRIRTRPDINWLLEVVQKIEDNRTIVKQLCFQANQTMFMVGDRANLFTYGHQENRVISLRATSVVRKAFELSRHPIPYSQLCDALIQSFPGVTLQQIENLLWRLWINRFLISDLQPPLAHHSPVDYVDKYLTRLKGTELISQQLARVLEKIKIIDTLGASAPVSLLHELSQHQVALAPGMKNRQPPVHIDAGLRLSSSLLHRNIGEAAALVAEILLRLSPAPEGRQALREYRNLFIERYGRGAEVPLVDLLTAENGLDAPPGYNQPSRAYLPPSTIPSSDTNMRDRILQKLVTSAINAQSLDVELTEQLLQQLERWSPKSSEAPYSLEIYLQVHAQSCEALDRGEWCAVVGQNCGSMAAGRTFGRFVDMLGEEGIAALRYITVQEGEQNPQAIFAELSYLPRRASAANAMVRLSPRSYQIVVSTTPSLTPEHVIPLSDLVVGVRHDRFYLRSLRLNKQVIACQTHMLNTGSAPNVCRFLEELAQDGFPILHSFSWGSVWHSPFLPRVFVRCGPTSSIVLSPAQWFVDTHTIMPGGDGDEEARWFRRVQDWREQWRVPRYVYLTKLDNRLLLDLEHPLMVAELRSEVAKLSDDARVQIQEVFPDFGGLWLHDERGEPYFSEIVIPLLRCSTSITEKPIGKSDAHNQTVLSHKERCIFPGEDWLFFKLYVTYRQHNKIIALYIKDIYEQLSKDDLISNWFFIRYEDPEPHLRLRFCARSSEAFSRLLNTLLQWSCQLAREGIIQRYSIDTYTRELERYGGPWGIALVEKVFSINSTLICNLIAAKYLKRITLDLQTLAVFTLDHFLTAWGWDFRQRLSWLRDRTGQYESSQEFRQIRKKYCELFSSQISHSDPYLTNQRALLHDLLKSQEQVIAQVGTQIRSLAAHQSLTTSEDELVASLLHMHCNRLLGIDQVLERQTYAFWRHTLESLNRRDQSRKV